MKQNYSRVRSYSKKLLFTFFAFCIAGGVSSQTYVNGNLGTGATSNNGAAAPAGSTWHELQHDSPTTSNSLLGSSHASTGTANFTVADDFTVPAGQTWSISTLRIYALDQVTTGTTSPFTNIRVRIWNGVPGAGGTIIYGDLVANRFAASAYSTRRGIFNSLVPTPGAPTPNLPIFSIDATINTVLSAGTYWVEWQVVNANNNFTPTSQTVGIRSLPAYNARQNNAGVWAAIIDAGSPAASPDVPVDLPFTINYTVAGACTGAPAPGNTVANPTAVCPGGTFTVSLQNNPPVSGLSYQWQSGPSATGPFTNITGATGSTYSSTLTGTTYYQAIVTCGTTSTTSAPVAVTLNAPSACYCTPPASDCTDGDIITNVRLGVLNNTSTCNAPSGYSNYTTNAAIPVPDLILGSANSMSVTAGGGIWTEFVGVWVDFNRDGTFQASEYTTFGSTTGGTLTQNINVPGTALTGVTRMRVRVRFNTALTGNDACLGYVFGETEDYNVNIVPCVQGVFTAQPANSTIGCSGNTTFTVTATGSALNYSWEYRTSPTGPWLLASTNPIFSNTNTNVLTVSNAPVSLNGYQFRAFITGACTAIDFSNIATLTVGPLVATVTPVSGNICSGSIQQLSITNTGTPATAVFPAVVTPLNIQIPDVVGPPASTPAQADAGINHTIPVAGIPAGAIITNVRVRLNITHTYAPDLVVVLRAPNGAILNLIYHRNSTGNTGGANYTNVVISSAAGLPFINTGTAPGHTGVYRPDASIGAGSYGDPSGSGPTGFAPTVTTFAGLTSIPNGNWTIAIQDPSTWGGDIGTLNNWQIEFDYGAPSTGIFAGGPAGTIFTDPAGTVPYNGTTPVSTVYVNPTASTTYTVVVSNPLCTSAPLNIPVTVSNTLSGVTTATTAATCSGGNATFTVAAAAGNMQNIQWQVSSNGGATYTNITNGGIYSGATTSVLTVTGATATQSGYLYRAVVSNACNSVTSNASTFTVNPTPVIVVSANPFTALTPGMTTVLSAAVSPNAGQSYQWYRNGVLITGATQNTLTVDVDGLGDYTVVVTDVNGCSSTSNSISITDLDSDIVFIYPSPNTGQFQVRYQSGAGNVSLPRMLNIYDSKGARVYSKSYSIGVPYERLDVDLRHHGKGIYQVELTDRNGARLKTGRVVIL